MQPAKDSFYVELRNRLITVNPQRTILLDGVMRPAIAVAENEPPGGSPPLCDTFYLHWGAARPVETRLGLLAMQCTVSYCTQGTEGNGFLDRGRALGSLDRDLLAISVPCNTAKCDYTTDPPAPLGSTIFWTRPVLSEARTIPPVIGRDATCTVFFYPEGGQ